MGNTGRSRRILVENTPMKVKESPIEEKPNVPYPQRLRRRQLDQQFGKFMEIFKKLHINIPFSEVLSQMLGYVKFMKDILAKKRKLEDYETVALSEGYNVILQKKIPYKLKDPCSFTIPCAIGNAVFEKTLCYLGASNNLMPLSTFKKLNLGEARLTTITLQLEDRSLTHLHDIIKDVLVKVDKFIFLAYFIILDMKEDKEVPIILGRPFLATRRALIDVQKRELKLRVQEKEVTFRVFNAIKHLHDNDNCFRVYVIKAIVSIQLGHSEPLETSLGHEDLASCDDGMV